MAPFASSLPSSCYMKPPPPPPTNPNVAKAYRKISFGLSGIDMCECDGRLNANETYMICMDWFFSLNPTIYLLFSNGIRLKIGMSLPGYQIVHKEELGIDWLYFFVVVGQAIKSCPSFFRGRYIPATSPPPPAHPPLLPSLYISF